MVRERAGEPAGDPRVVELLQPDRRLHVHDQRGAALGHQLGVRGLGRHQAQLRRGRIAVVSLVNSRGHAHYLGQRPVGDPLAVRQGATGQHCGAIRHQSAELGQQSALAYPGRAEQAHQPAASLGQRRGEGLLQMIVLGIVGGLVGGFVATNVLKMGSVDGINVESIVIATIGAIAVIFVARLATGKRGLSRNSG